MLNIPESHSISALFAMQIGGSAFSPLIKHHIEWFVGIKLSVMEKNYQNNNSISDTANNNDESNKPEHEIKVEIVSIEVVGEDT